MVWTGGSQGELAPCLVALFEQADARWPHRSKISDGTLGDPAHAARVSDHNPKPPNPPGWVDAADITEDDTRGPNLRRFWQHLISRRDPRVKYVIYEGEIVKSYIDSAGRPAWVPQPYTGPNPHASHLHISVLPEGRFDLSPWFPPPSHPPAPDHQESPMLVFQQAGGSTIYARLPDGKVVTLANPDDYGEALRVSRQDRAMVCSPSLFRQIRG